MKYFKSFWDLLEFVLLVFAVAVVAMYVFKQLLTSVALNALKDAEKGNGNFVLECDVFYSTRGDIPPMLLLWKKVTDISVFTLVGLNFRLW